MFNIVKHRQTFNNVEFGKNDAYLKLHTLGAGSYATVFKGKSYLKNNLVALKEIKLNREEGIPCTSIREVSILRSLKHNNIVTMYDIICTKMSLTIVMEYLEKDLKKLIEDNNNCLKLNDVKIFLFQILRGLSYCHKQKILHRDLKPQNLLINQKMELKLADFGLARSKSIRSKKISSEVVTLWYRPPDVLLGSTEYNIEIDIWSVGCIFFEMVTGWPLFSGNTVKDQLHQIFGTQNIPLLEKLLGDIRNELSLKDTFQRHVSRLETEGVNLLIKFLKIQPKARITAKEAMKEIYFYSLGSNVLKLPNNISIFNCYKHK